MNTLIRYKFHVIWAVAAILATIVYCNWNLHPDLLGIVETRTHKLGALESGRISKIYPALGQQVKANEVLAELDIGELQIERTAIEGELQRLRETLGADQQRYSLEYEKIRLQRDMDKRELAAKKAEKKALDEEIARLKKAEDAGLGRSRNMTDLIIRRDSLKRYLQENTGGSSRSDFSGSANKKPVVLSMLDKKVSRINELELQLRLISQRIDHRKIVSPCDGRVVKINYLPGDSVEGFSTILTVEEPTAAFIDVYIPETSNIKPSLGESIIVFPSRKSVPKSRGTIVFIDPGYSAVPERLAFRRIIYWARKFRVRLDENHGLMPGETAKVRIMNDINPLQSKAQADELVQPTPSVDFPQTREGNSLSRMMVPEELRSLSSLEPSGVAWLDDIKRYVIISDDTSRGEPEHVPWLYLMDTAGNVEHRTVPVDGIDSLNDVESIAPGPDGELYLVSSQSISSKNKRPADRKQLLKVERQGRSFKVTGKIDFLSAIRDLDEPAKKALGLDALDEKLIALNIEGAVWYQGSLLFGLKEPLSEKGAIIWRLQNPDALLKSGKLEPEQLLLFARADLKSPDGRRMGISDLAVDRNDRLFASATIPNAGNDEQCGALFHLFQKGEGLMYGELLYTFPHLKPEGVCFQADNRINIVFDTDDKPPFLYFSTGRGLP